MKTLSKTIFALFSALLTLPAFAGSDVGDDTARHYRLYPDKYDGKKVDVDCAYVSRVKSNQGVEGVVFFVAHTVDDDNGGRGGSIVVAVLEDRAESLMRSYGTAIERSGKSVDTKRLRGTLHKLDDGRIYIDESGEVHALIEAHIKEHEKFELPGSNSQKSSKAKKRL